ncbi:MAG: IS30 family transposase, partial [Neisseria sp.]|uniref:IS30 family transposase n=1 Tax=Neisseria sp. TaxID=192066 RepID=UPI0026DB7BCC
SRYLMTVWLPKKNAQALKVGMLDVLRDMPLRSITPDRGKEFALHAQLSDELQVPFYFPEPGQPWQRGSNENTNGLLRQYFPKRQDLGQYSAAQIQAVTDKINLRPRKCLGWKCAYEVLFRKTLRLV